MTNVGAQVALTGDVKLVVPFVTSPFVGIGLGGFYTAQSIEGGPADVVVLPDDELNFGWRVNGGLGLDVPEFPLRPFVEWRYNNVRIEGDPVQYHALLAGVTLKIPRTR